MQTFQNTYQVLAVTFNDTSDQIISGGIDNDIKVGPCVPFPPFPSLCCSGTAMGVTLLDFTSSIPPWSCSGLAVTAWHSCCPTGASLECWQCWDRAMAEVKWRKCGGTSPVCPLSQFAAHPVTCWAGKFLFNSELSASFS